MKNRRVRSWKLVIIPEDESGVRQFRLTRTGVTTFVVAIALLILYSGIETVLFWVVARRAAQVDPLRKRVLELESSGEAMQQMGSELTRLKGFEQQLRRILKGENPDNSDNANWEAESFETLPGQSKTAAVAEALKTTTNPVADARGVGGIAYTAMDVPTLSPVRGYVTRKFKAGGPSREVGHFGVDIAAREGTPVLAAADGLVVFADWTYRYGNLIAVSHRSGFVSFYGHNQVLLAAAGERVRQGEPIALMGNSGVSTAPHLHFEVWQDGSPIDPLALMSQYP